MSLYRFYLSQLNKLSVVGEPEMSILSIRSKLYLPSKAALAIIMIYINICCYFQKLDGCLSSQLF